MQTQLKHRPSLTTEAKTQQIICGSGRLLFLFIFIFYPHLSRQGGSLTCHNSIGCTTCSCCRWLPPCPRGNWTDWTGVLMNDGSPASADQREHPVPGSASKWKSRRGRDWKPSLTLFRGIYHHTARGARAVSSLSARAALIIIAFHSRHVTTGVCQ